MKLWIVGVEIEIPVVAETAEEAREIAYRDALQEACRQLSERDLVVRNFQTIPAGYEDDSLVWHDGKMGDVTLKEAMEKYGEKP